ncbi:MAG: exo-beta-N-acetylmuramidase NamZ domain-containing protein, partial [Acidobacteriota bacterium]
MPSPRVKPGLDVLLDAPVHDLVGGRAGLLAHPASVTSRLVHAIDGVRRRSGLCLTSLFAPEHGLRGEAQDMEAVDAGTDPDSGLTVYSLYG